MRGVVVGLLAVLLVAGGSLATGISATTALAASAASVDSADILVSTDGTTYGSTLPAGIFAGIGTLVPGDEVNRTLYVKNASTTRSYLRVSRVIGEDTQTLFSQAVMVEETGIPPTGGTTAGVGGGTGCLTLVRARLLDPGAVATIPLTLTVADLDHLDGQNQWTELSLVAGLFAADAPPPADSECPPNGTSIPIISSPTGSGPEVASGSADSGMLAFTGTTFFVPTVFSALVLLWLGVVAVVASRKFRHRRGQ